MVKYCVYCNIPSGNEKNRSFHRYPQDGKLCEIWKKITGKTNLPRDARLCSDHFNNSDIIICSDGRRNLKKGSTPFNDINVHIMLPMTKRGCCSPGCTPSKDHDGHQIINPKKYPEMFNSWVKVINNTWFRTMTAEMIY